MATPPTSLPEELKIPSLDSLKTLKNIQDWVRDFFQQCSETVLPEMSSEEAEKSSFVYDASFREGAYRVKGIIKGGVRIISEFEFPGQTHNRILRILPNNHIEGRFPDGSSLPKFSFNTGVKNGVLNMNNVADALGLAQAALETLQEAGEIVWTVESTGARTTHTVLDVLKEGADRAAAVLVG